MESENMKVESMKVEAEMQAASAKTIYREVLGSITSIDTDRYSYYINARRRKLAKWRLYNERADEGYYEMVLELAPPSFYVYEQWIPIANGWQEVTVYEVAILPPRYPLPPGYKTPATEIGLQVRCVYLEKLGRVEIDENFRGPRGRVVAQWTDFHSYDGFFENTLHLRRAHESVLVLQKVWKARFGYAGSGRQVYLITVPNEEVRG
jgi:hypothetical protein